MYSNLKKVAMASILFAVVNAVAAVLIFMFILPIAELDFPFKLALAAFVFSSPVVSLALSFGVWGLQNDLNMQSDNELEEMTDLKKRVEELERKVN